DSMPALAAGEAVLAVSAGGDSIAMAALLCEAGIIHPARCVVAHFDHPLRGAHAAARDGAAVEEPSSRYPLALELGAWDAPVGGETAAREARYGFLSGVARRRGLGVITTGHTSDDQVETVLMHAMRGAGLRGMRGMQAETALAAPRVAGRQKSED